MVNKIISCLIPEHNLKLNKIKQIKQESHVWRAKNVQFEKKYTIQCIKSLLQSQRQWYIYDNCICKKNKIIKIRSTLFYNKKKDIPVNKNC